MNENQVTELLKSVQASKMEATVYQYMPSFHMEHCVFAAFLSNGSSFRDCGKPCEKHEVKLKDQFQNWHQIKADQECRNTMYNAKAQSASRFFSNWSQLGLGVVRIEALKERGSELIEKILNHLKFFDGELSTENLLNTLNAYESYGISEGALGKQNEFKNRKKEQNGKF